MCTSGNINITDCDTLGGPKGYYDACMKTTIEMPVGEQTLTMNTMNCAVKVIRVRSRFKYILEWFNLHLMTLLCYRTQKKMFVPRIGYHIPLLNIAVFVI